MTNHPKIISLGYAVPPYSYSQEQVFEALSYPRHFWRIFRDAGVEKRHFSVPLERIRQLSFQEQQDEYQEEATELSMQAIANCLDGRNPKDIGCIVYGSCTGFCPGPSMSHKLHKILRLSPSTYHNNIIGQGCESGFPGLKRAYDFAMVTGMKALVVNCELCGLTYYPEPAGKPDPENDYELLRSNAIFGEAAVACLVGFDQIPNHPYIIDTETYTNTDYMGDLGYTWRSGRLRVLLSRRVPELAPKVVKPAVEMVLKRRGLGIPSINWWVIHAAGKTVLDNIRDALGLPEEKITLSRDTLGEFGNTSSTSVGITGKKLMLQEIKPGDYAAVLSIGPGISGGCSLLRFGGD